MIERITIQLVSHAEQRYNTVGDWFVDITDPGHLIIRGSWLNAKNPWLNWAVPIHELIEALSALAVGITPKQVDDFDLQFELDHADDEEEPGDDPRCPIHNQHMFAAKVEREFVTKMLSFDWDTYEELVEEPYIAARRKAKVMRDKLRRLKNGKISSK